MSQIKNKKDETKLAQIIENPSYAGNVHIKVYNKGLLYDNRLFHNTGTVALCNYIRDCLKGENVIAKRPGYLQPCSWSTDKGLQPMFNYGILYNGHAINGQDGNAGDTSSTCSLTFIIPSLVLSGKSQIHGFKLYSLGKTMIEYASVDIHDNPIILTSNANLSIVWDLKISYK